MNTVEMDILGLDQIFLAGGYGLEGGFGASCICPSAYRSDISLPAGSGTSRVQPGEGMLNPAPMFYIEGGSKKILVETGLSQENVDVFNHCAEKYGINQFYRKRPEHDVVDLLASRGVTPPSTQATNDELGFEHQERPL